MSQCRRPLVLLLAALCAALFAGRCNQPQPILLILEPSEGEVISDCSVSVLVHTKGTANPATLSADLNGQPVTLTQVAPGTTAYQATVPIDFPLAASNTLVVSVQGVTTGSSTRTVNFSFSAAEPRARQITDAADLITGPHGNSRIGDWLIENCTARFIVQDAPQRDLTGVAEYGGNLIDAELRGQPGMDNFAELQPILNIETVVNADTVLIVNDGNDGNPAIVRTCGPDDPLDYINANSLVDDLLGPGSFPASANDVDLPIVGCTEYSLTAGDNFLEITTTVTNTSDPVTGTDVSLYVGDYLNASGETEQWTSEFSNVSGLTSGIGEMAVNFGFGVFSMFGFNEAAGVDYAYIPMSTAGSSSSFTTSGVSAILHENSVVAVLFVGFPPVFSVPKGSSNSFTRLFGVGDGSAGNALDLKLAIDGTASGTLHGCVTVGGVAAPGARVAAGFVLGGEIENLFSHWVTDENGCYSGQIPVNGFTLGVAASMLGTPYEGGGTAPVFHSFTMTAGADILQDIALPATGHVQIFVTDENGDPLPARIGVVGVDPSPEIVYNFSLAGQIDISSSTFRDVGQDGIPAGLTWVAYASASGALDFDLEPGTYDIAVSRGTEYSAHIETVTVSAAPAPQTVVSAQLAHVLDTTGFISSDFHVHLLPSSDSQISHTKRVISFAGEGVDNIIVTDHDRHTDLNPTIAALGLTAFVNSTVGEEITTFDYGHFNAYPLGQDPDRITQGSTDWARPAAVGAGFTTSVPPAYTSLPSQIFDLVFTGTKLAGGLINASPEIAVQVNHIGSHFSPLKIDTASVPIRSFMTPAEMASRRFDPATPPVDFFHPFDAVELWNGYTASHQDEFLVGRIGIWANLLNQGIKTTAIYDTDTHDFFTTRSGGARTWTPSTSDAPAAVLDDEIGAAVKAGKAVGGQGIYVQTRLVATNAPANIADFTLTGDTQVTVPDGQVTLEIEIQAPTWAPYDRIEIYHNSSTSVAGTNGTTPVDYGANPDVVLQSNLGDFAVSTLNVFPSVPGASRLESSVTRSFTVTQDTWFAVVVKGTSGVSVSMFPVMPADSGTGGVMALGATNALYVDFDGNGLFDAPGVTVVP